MKQRRTELDCPHEDCRAIIPVRFDPEDEYEGRYECRCGGTKLYLFVKGGEARITKEDG